MVSILILLDVILEGYIFAGSAGDIVSFNPYFVGCYSGRSPDLVGKALAMGFNPYFVGCYSGSCGGREGNGSVQGVSILILLDVILEVRSTDPHRWKYRSFNPYFVGCYSGSSWATIAGELDIPFQSLFCWMLFWKYLECSDKSL